MLPHSKIRRKLLILCFAEHHCDINLAHVTTAYPLFMLLKIEFEMVRQCSLYSSTFDAPVALSHFPHRRNGMVPTIIPSNC